MLALRRPPGLIRVSVGCEHLEDIWDDLSAAIDHTTRARS
jgi:cystathionine beta-lyase/cystathionine gamma-synthase